MIEKSTPGEYLQRAKEALRLAETAKEPVTKAVLLKLAAVWEKLARRAGIIIVAGGVGTAASAAVLAQCYLVMRTACVMSSHCCLCANAI